MRTYEIGYDLAQNDIKRFGILHAFDKMEVLDGEFGTGYTEAVESFVERV